MAFYKKIKLKSNGKWYPLSVTVGKPVTTTEIAERISAKCTVNPADVSAVLVALGPTLSEFMTEGRSAKLDGMGTFYYTSNAEGNGVEKEEEVSPAQIKGVRVRFVPQTRRSSSRKVTSRALVNDDISWIEWGKSLSGKEEE